MRYSFSHIGVPVPQIPENAEFVEKLQIYRIDSSEDPMCFEYTHFLKGSCLPEALQHELHIGYLVDNIHEALKEAEEVLMPPRAVPQNKQIAFVRRQGVLVELIAQGGLNEFTV